jgi:hypothetical protein
LLQLEKWPCAVPERTCRPRRKESPHNEATEKLILVHPLAKKNRCRDVGKEHAVDRPSDPSCLVFCHRSLEPTVLLSLLHKKSFITAVSQ